MCSPGISQNLFRFAIVQSAVAVPSIVEFLPIWVGSQGPELVTGNCLRQRLGFPVQELETCRPLTRLLIKRSVAVSFLQ